jgi:hypothetical protein
MLDYLKKKIRVNHVYIMVSPDFPYRAKVGFSNAPKWRAAAIRDSIKQEIGRAVIISRWLSFPLVSAQYNEKAIHALIDTFSTSTVPGSGRSEWFWILNVFSAIIAALAFWAFGVSCPLVRAAVILVLPLPLDLTIFITLLAFFQYALILGGAWILASVIF